MLRLLSVALLVVSTLAVPASAHLLLLEHDAGCSFAGQGFCTFRCEPGQRYQAHGAGEAGVLLRATCPGSVWTCELRAPLLMCGTNQLSGSGPGRCELSNGTGIIACVPAGA